MEKYVEKIHLQRSSKFIFLNPKPKGLQEILYAQGFTPAYLLFQKVPADVSYDVRKGCMNPGL